MQSLIILCASAYGKLKHTYVNLVTPFSNTFSFQVFICRFQKKTSVGISIGTSAFT